MRARKNNSIIFCSLLLVFSIMLTSCGSNNKARGNSSILKNTDKNNATTLNNNPKTDSSSASPQVSTGSNSKDKQSTAATQYNSIQSDGTNARKIVKSSTISIESLSFDKAVNSLTEKIKLAGGYIENSTISGTRTTQKDYATMRNANFTLRIPKQNFDLFTSDVGTLGNILSKSNKGEDITAQYFDTEAHLKSLKIEEDRLLELLKKSGDLKDIILLETELSNVRYQIETFTGNLKKWDNMVDYSTLTVDITEVKEVSILKEKPVTLIEKIKDGFLSSGSLLINMVKGLMVIVAAILPFLPLIIALYFLTIYLIKRKNKRPL